MIKRCQDTSQIERVISVGDAYAVVEKLIVDEYLKGGASVQMAPIDHDPRVRDEALRTLYRLRANLIMQEEQPRGVLRAIESLIEEYEATRT